MAAADDTMKSEARERVVVGRLRVIVAVLLVFGAVACVLGYLPHGFRATDREYVDHVESAGGDSLAIFLLLLFAPSIAVLRRPSSPLIMIWVLWAFPCTLLALLVAVGPGENLYSSNEFLWPLWPARIAYSLIAAILFGIFLVVPAVRRTHRSPPLQRRSRLPAARIHRA